MASRICDELQLTWFLLDLVAVAVAVAVAGFCRHPERSQGPRGTQPTPILRFFQPESQPVLPFSKPKETYTAWPSPAVPNQAKQRSHRSAEGRSMDLACKLLTSLALLLRSISFCVFSPENACQVPKPSNPLQISKIRVAC